MQLDIHNLVRFRVQPSEPHEIRYNCPHCDDTKGKLWFNTKKESWVCFHCGNGGHVSGRDILPGVHTILGPQLRDEGLSATLKWKTHPKISGSGMQYLKSHNIDYDVAFRAGVRSGKGDISGRLVIPVKAMGTERVVFRTAHASDSSLTPKTISYGKKVPLVLQHNDAPYVRTAVIVEGPADALRLHSAALKDKKFQNHISVVALFGKFLSEQMAFDLTKRYRKFYILLDRESGTLSKSGETVAAMRAMSVLSALASGNVMRHIWAMEASRFKDKLANDPAELSDEWAAATLKTAIERT